MTSSSLKLTGRLPAQPLFGTGLLQRWLAGIVIALLALTAAAQQKAGEVTHLQGMATAQQPGDGLRFLGSGDAVLEGDVLTTTDKGFAVITLSDGTKFTLRPSTSFVLERYSQNPGAEAAVMRLFKGGMRMASGQIAKRNPAGIELRVNTATVGIIGTSFDARICGADCRQENAAPSLAALQAAQAGVVTGIVAARVVQSTGEVAASQPGKPARPLAVGAPLYEGDVVRTGAGGVAVIGFKDQSKVSVNPQSTLRIDAFVYNKPQTPDAMGLSLLKGGLRAFTGLIGKKSPDAFSVKTKTSTVGIRGTGMDISCEGPCVDASLSGAGAASAANSANPKKPDGLFMLTWVGGSYFFVGPLDVPLNRVGFIGGDGVARLLENVPDFFKDFGSPRPDQVEVNWDNLFATVLSLGADGLYVLVRDGHVFMSDSSRIDLGINEAGYLGPNGLALRLAPVPSFLLNDPYPLPELFTNLNGQIFQLFGVTLGQPGQEICRL
ncbi:MAG: FecR domain-containing protein [Rhodoferax sp.]|nr:FecR domain-containing protein [Rhodoferax sp.]